MTSQYAGRVRLTPVTPAGPALQVDLLGQASVSGGVGGWTDLARPLRTTAAEWVGTPTLTQTLTVLLDGMPSLGRPVAVSIEPRAAALLALGVATKETGRPPVLTLAGPLYFTDRRWVVDDLSWGTEIRNDTGERVQQDVTITLREWIATASVKGPAAKSRDRRKYAIGDTANGGLGIGNERNS